MLSDASPVSVILSLGQPTRTLPGALAALLLAALLVPLCCFVFENIQQNGHIMRANT